MLDGMRLELGRRGDYAVRAMLALAGDDDGAWISAPRISDAMRIPAGFLPRIMRDLAAAGLVEARTGRSGGYRLARAAAEISLMDVIRAADPEDDGRQCVLRGIPCGLDGVCIVHHSFDAARSALQERLAAATLDKLVAGRPDTTG